MGIVKWCHPGDLVSMPLFGRYYRTKSVTLDCGLLVLFPLHRLVLVPSIGGEWCLLLHQPIPPFGMICFWFGNQENIFCVVQYQTELKLSHLLI